MEKPSSETGSLEQIQSLIKGGESEKAYEQLKGFLVKDTGNIDAWNILLEISATEQEKEYARYQIARLEGVVQPPISGGISSSEDANKGEADLDPGDWQTGEVHRAIALMQSGKTTQARKLIDIVLQKNPDLPQAVFLLGMLTNSKQEYSSALEKLVSLSGKNPDAKPLYEKLSARKLVEKRHKSKLPIWIIAGGVSLLLILIVFGLIAPLIDGNSGRNNTAVILEEVAESGELSCEELIARALEVTDEGCKQIGSNQVCYGNYRLDSVVDGPPEAFDLVGDVLGIELLKSLKASPLDVVKELWGVAVFKLKANMPGTVPGQTVTFLAFGNTEIDNLSGDMTAFYFSTGFGGIQCNGVDFDGLKIEMADGAGIEFVVNGVEIRLQGDAILVAEPGGELDVTVVSGTGEVTSDGVSRTLVPGTSVSIPIDENLEAAGVPGAVEEVSGAQENLICQLYGINCPEGVTSFILSETVPTSTPTITQTFTDTPDGFIASDTPVFTPTFTLTPTITPTPTRTPIGFVASNTPIPSKTPVPPTATFTLLPPTDTLVPPTETLVPPTNTPAPVACSEISVIVNNYGRWQITNNGDGPIILESMKLWWPFEENGAWTKVYLDNQLIASVYEYEYVISPAAHVFEGHQKTRIFNPGDSWEIITEYKDDLNPGTYDAEFTFDNGCTIGQ